MSFERNVFVNCPFDERFLPLLRPLLFTIIYLDLSPRIALERTDSGESRLDKILQLIRESKYSIHDLSRSEAAAVGELYRLNMPFDLASTTAADYSVQRGSVRRRHWSWNLFLTDTRRLYRTFPVRTLSVTMTNRTRSLG